MGYCSIADVRAEGFTLAAFPDARVTVAIDRATAFIESVTDRFFEPRDRQFFVTWTGERGILDLPAIIAIDEVVFVNTDASVQTPLALTDFIVFNRHVQDGQRFLDDRESPRIEFQFISPGVIVPRRRRLLQQVLARRVQNVRLTGRFGYTDPDPAVARTIATNAGDAITAPNTIKMVNGAFTEADVRAKLTIAGSASNNGTSTIKKRVSADTVETTEQTLVTEGSGFTGTLAEFPQSGITPTDIQYACLLLVARRFLTKLADVDPSAPVGARILKETVRDMSRTFQQDIRITRGDASFTGDPEVDFLLARFTRPPRVAIV